MNKISQHKYVTRDVTEEAIKNTVCDIYIIRTY